MLATTHEDMATLKQEVGVVCNAKLFQVLELLIILIKLMLCDHRITHNPIFHYTPT
jgi:hypothetical protein